MAIEIWIEILKLSMSKHAFIIAFRYAKVFSASFAGL